MKKDFRKAGSFNKWDLLAALAGALLAAAFLIISIFQSTSSTSVVGLIFLPFAFFIGGVLGYLTLWVIKNIFEILSGRQSWVHPKSLATIVVLLSVALGGGRYQMEKDSLSRVAGKELTAAQLEEIFFADYLFLGDQVRNMAVEHPLITERIQKFVAEGSNNYMVGLMGKNPALSKIVIEKIVNEAPLYERQFGVASNENLTEAQMNKLLKVREADFPSAVHFRLYQTFVMAPIIRRKDLTENSFSSIADLSGPEVFLLYAILDSPFLKCEQFRNFSSHENPAVQSAIEQKLQKLKCG